MATKRFVMLAHYRRMSLKANEELIISYSLLITRYSLLQRCAFPCAFGRRGVAPLLATRYSLLALSYKPDVFRKDHGDTNAQAQAD